MTNLQKTYNNYRYKTKDLPPLVMDSYSPRLWCSKCGDRVSIKYLCANVCCGKYLKKTNRYATVISNRGIQLDCGTII